MTAEEGPNPTCVGLGTGGFDIEIAADAGWVLGRVITDACAERRNSWAGGLTRYDGNE